MSIEKIYLRGINPTLPTVYDDGLSYMEAIAKLQYKINECIDLLKTTNVEGINEKLKETLEYVDTEIKNVNDKLAEQLDDVTTEINRVIVTLEGDIADTNLYNKNLVEQSLNRIQRMIDEKSLNVQATNPLTGKREDVDKCLGITDSLCRDTALTCFGYDVLVLTANDFDAFNTDCYLWDKYGKRTYFENILNLVEIEREAASLSLDITIKNTVLNENVLNIYASGTVKTSAELKLNDFIFKIPSQIARFIYSPLHGINDIDVLLSQSNYVKIPVLYSLVGGEIGYAKIGRNINIFQGYISYFNFSCIIEDPNIIGYRIFR